MKCKEIKKLLSTYIDGELDPERIQEVTEHLKQCKACFAQLATFKKIWDLLDTLPEATVQPFFANKVMHRIESRSQLSRLRHYVGDFFNRAVIPAAVAAGILIGLFLGNFVNEKQHLKDAMANVDPTIQPITAASEDFTAFPPGSLADTYLVIVSSGK